MIVEHGRAAPDQPDNTGSRREIDRLVREHDNMAQLLVVLDSQLASVASGEDADDELMRDAVLYLTQFADRFHHAKEDLAVQAAADRLEAVRALQPELAAQHRRIQDSGGALSDALGRMLLDYPVERRELAAAGFAYTAEVRRNMEFEELRVFPHLVQALDRDAWRRIVEKLGAEPDPLFGEVVHERYASLFRALTRRFGIEP